MKGSCAYTTELVAALKAAIVSACTAAAGRVFHIGAVLTKKGILVSVYRPVPSNGVAPRPTRVPEGRTCMVYGTGGHENKSLLLYLLCFNFFPCLFSRSSVMVTFVSFNSITT